jgi:uncharacterized protein (TIRG00374 family)
MISVMGWTYLSLGIVVSFFCMLIISVRYRLILVSLGENFSHMHSIYTTAVSQLSSYLLPIRVSSFMTRPLAVKFFSGASIKKAAIAATFDQIFETSWEIISLPFMLIAISNLEMGMGVNMILMLLAVVLVIVVMSRQEKVFYFFWRFRFLAPKKVRSFLLKKNIRKKQILDMIKESSRLFSNKKLVFSVAVLTSLSLVIFPLMLSFSVYFLGGQIDYKAAFLIFWISLIVGKLSGIPGGFISRDVTMLGLMNLYGLDVLLAGESIVVYRLVSLVPHLIFGVPPLIMTTAKKSIRC